MLIRKNVEWTQILFSQGTNSHGVSKKHPNRLVHNWKYCSWACNRISDHGLLSHSHMDRMESKECCRTRQTEPRLLLESTWVMLSHDRRCQVLLPQTDFHGFSWVIMKASYWFQPEKLRKAWQGVCYHFCLGPIQIKKLHKIHGDKWGVPKPQESAVHRYSGAVGCSDQGSPVQGTGLGTTGEGQRWGGKICSVASTPGIWALCY